METVKHKLLGIGEVVGREVKENCTNITVRFANGREMRLSIPESFEVGLISAEGSLKDEVDRAIMERKERKLKEFEESASSTAASRKATVGRKPSDSGVSKGVIEKNFEKYLISAGYKEETDSGLPSTVSSYIKGVRNVLDEEGISWSTLATSISDIIPIYDAGGKKEHIGAKSKKTVINALKRFEEFINS